MASKISRMPVSVTMRSGLGNTRGTNASQIGTPFMIETGTRIRRLVVVLVVVTKYDREGYLIQFYKGVLPCNTLAAMWSLTEAAFASSELARLLCRVIAFDERGRCSPF